MAHFYAQAKGSRGMATRCGTKSSGLTTIAASWGGAIEVDIWHDETAHVDRYAIRVIPWEGSGQKPIEIERGIFKTK